MTARRAGKPGNKTPNAANRAFYSRLRYGVRIKPEVGAQNITIWLIDGKNQRDSHFAIAEEVMVTGENTKRPDAVLYISGLALRVLELKRSPSQGQQPCQAISGASQHAGVA